MKRILTLAALAILLAAALVPATGRAGDESSVDLSAMTLDGFNFSNLVNSNITKEDLIGKVVMVEMWGTKCGPCLGEIPQLCNFYRKTMAETMSFELVGIESQNSGYDATLEIVNQNKVPYPVAVSGHVSGYSGSGIPARVIFDHTGKCIHKSQGGIESTTYKILEDAIAAAPHPLLGETPYVKLNKEAQMIRKGQNWGKVLSKLREINADENADEAEKAEMAVMFPRLDKYANKQLEKAADIAQDNPVLGVEAYKKVAAEFKGDEIADKADEQVKEITGAKTYKVEMLAWQQWSKVEESLNKYGLKNKTRNKEMLQGCVMLETKFDGTAAARKASELKPKLEACLTDTGSSGDR